MFLWVFLNRCFDLQHALLERLQTLVQLLWLNVERIKTKPGRKAQ